LFSIVQPLRWANGDGCLQLERDIYEDDEEIGYTWVREYHWDVSLLVLPPLFFLLVFCNYVNLLGSSDS
jgi:hypothetical protein